MSAVKTNCLISFELCEEEAKNVHCFTRETSFAHFTLAVPFHGRLVNIKIDTNACSMRHTQHYRKPHGGHRNDNNRYAITSDNASVWLFGADFRALTVSWSPQTSSGFSLSGIEYHIFSYLYIVGAKILTFYQETKKSKIFSIVYYKIIQFDNICFLFCSKIWIIRKFVVPLHSITGTTTSEEGQCDIEGINNSISYLFRVSWNLGNFNDEMLWVSQRMPVR